MTAPPEHPFAPGPTGAMGDDPTRDIRLPPVPGRAAPSLPAAWAQPMAAEEILGETPAEEVPAERAAIGEEPARSWRDERTDEHLPPPLKRRDPTLAFSSPEMRHRPIDPVQVGRSPRRWPWFVLAALPVLIIVGTGIWLLLLLRAA